MKADHASSQYVVADGTIAGVMKRKNGKLMQLCSNELIEYPALIIIMV